MQNRIIALSRCSRNFGLRKLQTQGVCVGSTNVHLGILSDSLDKRQKRSKPFFGSHSITGGERSLFNLAFNVDPTSRNGNHRSFSTTTYVMKNNDSSETFITSSDASLNESFKNIDALVEPSTESAITDTNSCFDTAVATEGVGNFEFERLGWPSDYCIDLILKIHENMEIDIASSVCLLTLATRTLMLPIFVRTQRSQSRMTHLMPELNAIKAKVDAATDQETKMKLGRQMQALFKKYNVTPMANFGLLLVQMPVFMTMFFALKRMPDIFPEQLASESFLWCSDIGLSDPTYGLPLLTGATFIGIIEMTKSQMKSTSGAQGETMVKVMRGLGVIMVPFIASFPVIMFTYWVPNNLWSFGQTAAFQNQKIRKMLGIWDPPKPVPGAPQPQSPLDAFKKAFGQTQKRLEEEKSAAEAKLASERDRPLSKEALEAYAKRQNRINKIRGARPLGSVNKGKNKGKRR